MTELDIVEFLKEHDRQRLESDGFTVRDLMDKRGITRNQAQYLISAWRRRGEVEPTGGFLMIPDCTGRSRPRPAYRPVRKQAITKPKIVARKLGRHGARGLCWNDGVIELDERLKGKERLEVLLHEIDHHLHPDKTEVDVEEEAKRVADILWEQRVRIIDEA